MGRDLVCSAAADWSTPVLDLRRTCWCQTPAVGTLPGRLDWDIAAYTLPTLVEGREGFVG